MTNPRRRVAFPGIMRRLPRARGRSTDPAGPDCRPIVAERNGEPETAVGACVPLG